MLSVNEILEVSTRLLNHWLRQADAVWTKVRPLLFIAILLLPLEPELGAEWALAGGAIVMHNISHTRYLCC